MFVISGDPGLHVHLDGHRNVVLEQSIHAAVVLNLCDHNRKCQGCVLVISGGAHIVENNPGAPTILAIAAGKDNPRNVFLGQERIGIVPKFDAFQIAIVG